MAFCCPWRRFAVAVTTHTPGIEASGRLNSLCQCPFLITSVSREVLGKAGSERIVEMDADLDEPLFLCHPQKPVHLHAR